MEAIWSNGLASLQALEITSRSPPAAPNPSQNERDILSFGEPVLEVDVAQ